MDALGRLDGGTRKERDVATPVSICCMYPFEVTNISKGCTHKWCGSGLFLCANKFAR